MLVNFIAVQFPAGSENQVMKNQCRTQFGLGLWPYPLLCLSYSSTSKYIFSKGPHLLRHLTFQAYRCPGCIEVLLGKRSEMFSLC